MAQPGTNHAPSFTLVASGDCSLTPVEGSLVPANRVPALDVVRAVSLFGVLVVNVDTQFRVSPFERFLPPGADVVVEAPLDQLVGRAISIGFDTKPLVLFSFLFGMG